MSWPGFGFFSFALCTLAPACEASVEISTAATKNMTCSGGVCTPTAEKAILNVGDLASLLASGNLKITSNSVAPDILFAAPFSWASASRLTLDSYRSVVFRQSLTTAGPGALTIVTNDGSTGRDYWFEKNGRIQFWGVSTSSQGRLIINGEKYTLVSSIQQYVRAVERDQSAPYALANSYDAANDGTYSEAPISFASGTFEGLGNEISNLSVVEATGDQVGVGLFDRMQGTIRDLHLSNVLISVGASRSLAGGLAAVAYGPIVGCSVSGSVSGGQYSGGLAGDSVNSVEYSAASADVKSTNPKNTFNVAGGLAGDSDYPVFYSYATGAVTGGENAFVGGLIGAQGSGLLAWDYATGPVIGGVTSQVGGLVGGANDQIKQSYSTGSVTGGSGSAVGGFIGYSDPGGYSATYWDTDTSGRSLGCGMGNCSGVAGLTDAQLKSALPQGFDNSVWGQNATINNGYPYLLANPPPQ